MTWRFVAYKQFIFWIYSFFREVRKVIPSCVLWAIRNKFSSSDGSYISFAESKVDKESKPQELIF